MRKLVKKIIENKHINILLNIITLNGQKRFIVSSLTYYLTISLVPLSTIIYIFLKILNKESSLDFINSFIPVKYEMVDKIFIFSNNPVVIFITLVISIYVASKGLLNYYHFLNEKFNIPPSKYPFLFDSGYIAFLTLITCLIYSILKTLYYLIDTNNVMINILVLLLKFSSTFVVILMLNYLLLKRKIKIKQLIIGSLVSSALLYIINALYLKYAEYFIKETYYGILTQVIILLLYLYFVCYSFLIGNEINFLNKEKKCRSTFHS